MTQIIIMRGLPGSGKSTWLREFHPDAKVCSADNYFIGEDGVYVFDGTKLAEAHGKCLRDYVKLLTSNADLPGCIAVDNTGTRTWEISSYYTLAEAFGFDVKVVYLKCDPEFAYSRNVHGVSAEQVERMNLRITLEDPPSHWNVETIEGY